MNKEWYNIDVKKEVLQEVEQFLKESSIDLSIIGRMKSVSVRDMMDIDYIRTIPEIHNPIEFSEFVRERYMVHREDKYGQAGFWESAANERNIGYKGTWYRFITDLLCSYCDIGDNVFFVGTADGKEIPEDNIFNYYALEQIGKSVKKIDKKKVLECYKADFEDENFIVNNGHWMNAIVALRCLMPNTRLNYFFKFVENNIRNSGILILSHPMGFLDVNNLYKPLPNCDKSRLDFDNRLKNELKMHSNFEVIQEIKTDVEYFYIIKAGEVHESIADKSSR